MDPIFKVSALANFAAAFNLAVTGHILLLLELAGNPATESETSMLASSAFVGAIVGQFTFGYFANQIGIEFGLAMALFLCTAGNILAAFLAWKPVQYEVLSIFRFVVGVGAGGVYPLSAVASAESSDGSNRGRRMMLVFSFQGVGQIAAPLSVVLLDAILPNASQAAWRISLLIGSLPSAYAIPIALTIKSRSERQSRLCMSSPSSPKPNNGFPTRDYHVAADPHCRRHERKTCSFANMYLLLGTAGTWFLFDIVFYGNIIFTPFILEKVFAIDEFHPNKLAIAGYSVIIYLCALPGIYLSSYVADSWGRKKLQIVGFSACALIFAFLSVRLHNLSENWLFVLYLLTFFFYNFGPNSTTFCLPAETFDANVRTFFNGVSAACGKAGAVVGAAIFKYILDEHGLSSVVVWCSIICVFGVVLTLVAVVDKRGQSLDDEFDDELRLDVDDHPRSSVSELELT